jgi:hypothetical protein
MNQEQPKSESVDRTFIAWPFPPLDQVLKQKYDRPPVDGPRTTKPSTEVPND